MIDKTNAVQLDLCDVLMLLSQKVTELDGEVEEFESAIIQWMSASTSEKQKLMARLQKLDYLRQSQQDIATLLRNLTSVSTGLAGSCDLDVGINELLVGIKLGETRQRILQLTDCSENGNLRTDSRGSDASVSDVVLF